MLATRSRPSSQQQHQHRQQQHQQQQHEVVHSCKGGLFAVLVVFAAVGSASASGGYPLQHTSTIGSSHRPCFLGLTFGEKKAPAVPEPPSIGDRFREIGDRVRSGGVGALLAGKASASGEPEEAMAAAQVLSESQRRQQPHKDKSNGRNSFVAGGLAGAVSTTITCPIEVT